MSDRLSDLRRQRTLVLDQLTWLDREITRESEALAAKSAPPIPLPPTATGAAPASAAPLANPEDLLAEYRVTPETVHENVRKGCFLYFIGAFVALGLFLVALYFLLGRR